MRGCRFRLTHSLETFFLGREGTARTRRQEQAANCRGCRSCALFRFLSLFLVLFCLFSFLLFFFPAVFLSCFPSVFPPFFVFVCAGGPCVRARMLLTLFPCFLPFLLFFLSSSALPFALLGSFYWTRPGKVVSSATTWSEGEFNTQQASQ